MKIMISVVLSNFVHDLSTVTETSNTTVVNESKCYSRQPSINITSTVQVSTMRAIPASEGQTLSL